MSVVVPGGSYRAFLAQLGSPEFRKLWPGQEHILSQYSRSVGAQQPSDDYAAALIRSFDDHLEHLGARGDKFDDFCQRISQNLQSDRHGEYCEGLEQLGRVLGYQARRPKGKAASDNHWRGMPRRFPPLRRRAIVDQPAAWQAR